MRKSNVPDQAYFRGHKGRLSDRRMLSPQGEKAAYQFEDKELLFVGARLQRHYRTQCHVPVKCGQGRTRGDGSHVSDVPRGSQIAAGFTDYVRGFDVGRVSDGAGYKVEPSGRRGGGRARKFPHGLRHNMHGAEFGHGRAVAGMEYGLRDPSFGSVGDDLKFDGVQSGCTARRARKRRHAANGHEIGQRSEHRRNRERAIGERCAYRQSGELRRVVPADVAMHLAFEQMDRSGEERRRHGGRRRFLSGAHMLSEVRRGKDMGEKFLGRMFGADSDKFFGRGGGRGHGGGRGAGEGHRGGFGGNGRGGGARGGRRRVLDAEKLRLIMLDLIRQSPRHGYDVIRAIEEMTQGQYAPSPGVVYPTLTLLSEIGLIAEEALETGRKRFAITSDGDIYLQAHETALAEVVARLKALAGPEITVDMAPVQRAMRNLQDDLAAQLSREGADKARILDIAALIDEAAHKIERL